MRAELEDEELEEELLLELDEEPLELDDELLLELDELLLLEEELDDPELDDDELDGELELDDPSGVVGLPSSHACSSTPNPARARPPERVRRNCRRSSRRAFSSGLEGFLNMIPQPPA
jgi:hypothetical protein